MIRILAREKIAGDDVKTSRAVCLANYFVTFIIRHTLVAWYLLEIVRLLDQSGPHVGWLPGFITSSSPVPRTKSSI